MQLKFTKFTEALLLKYCNKMCKLYFFTILQLYLKQVRRMNKCASLIWFQKGRLGSQIAVDHFLCDSFLTSLSLEKLLMEHAKKINHT